jgi:lipoprotein LprG
MVSLPGFEFQIKQVGSTVYLDFDETILFNEASGHYVAPDSAQTKIKITAMGLVTEVTLISLQEAQWISNPLTGQYQELPPEYIFKPTQYLDQETGFFPALGSGALELVLVGDEELEEMPGLTLTHISGKIPGEVIAEVSQGLIEIESLAADTWIDRSTNEVHRVVLTDTASETSWQFDFWNFGATIEITAP